MATAKKIIIDGVVYPSAKTPGIYPRKIGENYTDEELGLDSTDIINFSLGNWNSIIKQNKILLTGLNLPIDERGVRVNIQFDYEYILYYKIKRNTQPGPPSERSVIQNGGTHKYDGMGDVTKSDSFIFNDEASIQYTYPATKGVYLDTTTGNTADGIQALYRIRKFLSYFYNDIGEQVELDDPDKPDEGRFRFSPSGLKTSEAIMYEDGDAFIQEKNTDDNSINLQLDNTLQDKIASVGKSNSNHDYPNGIILRKIGLGDEEEDPYGEGLTFELMFPAALNIKNPLNNTEGKLLGLSNDIVNLGNPSNSRLVFFPENGLRYSGNIATSQGLSTSLGATLGISDDVTEDISEGFFDSIGSPNFKFNIIVDNANYIKNVLSLEPINFIVDLKPIDSDEPLNRSENDLLYYNKKDLRYKETSYPIEVDFNISLFDYPNFNNNLTELEPDDVSIIYAAAFISTGNAAETFLTDNILEFKLPDTCYYKYRVVQWGDEKQQLSDNQLENTYLFNLYDREDYPNPNEFEFKKYLTEQSTKTIPIQEYSSHVYNTPGVKSIKIALYRYTKNGAFILQTYLITKNIAVNDGVLSAQDFSVFGGSDFTFLPISDNQAIIGGLDKESKYNDSISKIVKDDNFIQEDYLERISSKDYIEKLNSGVLGKRPGQLDLGQTRVFTQPKDIYDFITDDKQSIVNNNFVIDTLPVNSSATDIFIRDKKCVVDLNPANSEFLSIQNQVGLKEQGIIIGDYKINQPENSRVQKEGVMKTPILETNNEKQAF